MSLSAVPMSMSVSTATARSASAVRVSTLAVSIGASTATAARGAPPVLPASPRVLVLGVAEVFQLAIALAGPLLPVLFCLVQLCLGFLHEGKGVVGRDARVLPLLAPGVFVAPRVLALQARIVGCGGRVLDGRRLVVLGRVPGLEQAVLAACIREAHGVLVLEGLLLPALLALGICVLLALHGGLEVDGEEVDVAGVVGQGRIARGLAQLEEPSVGDVGVVWVGHGGGQTDVHVGVIFVPEPRPLPVVAARWASVLGAVLGVVGGQRRGRVAAEEGSAACSVEVLGALVGGSLAGGGGVFVGLDAGDVGGAVDVP